MPFKLVEWIKKHKVAVGIIAAILVAALVLLLLQFQFKVRIFNHFTERFEGYNPDYEKELKLFRQMSMSEQQEYLEMNKESKISKYGKKII